MKAISVLLLLALGLAAQTNDPDRFGFEVTGRVNDGRGKAVAKAGVCWFHTTRPLKGRIICTETAPDGTYRLAVEDTAGEYHVWASNKGIRCFLIPVGKRAPNGCRSATSERFKFDSDNRSRLVHLQLRTFPKST